MSIAFLQRHPDWAEWMESFHPGVNIFEEVNEDLLSHDLILIMPGYRIEGRYFHILSLWQELLTNPNAEAFAGKKLGMIGAVEHKSSNYLYVDSCGDDLRSWGKQAKLAQDLGRSENIFPKMVDHDILGPLKKAFLSHGDRTLHVLFDKFLGEVRLLEKGIGKGEGIDYLMKSATAEKAHDIMREIRTLWKFRKDFFSLMPHFPQIKSRYEQINTSWVDMRRFNRLPHSDLSDQVISLVEIITEITSIYEMKGEKDLP